MPPRSAADTAVDDPKVFSNRLLLLALLVDPTPPNSIFFFLLAPPPNLLLTNPGLSLVLVLGSLTIQANSLWASDVRAGDLNIFLVGVDSVLLVPRLVSAAGLVVMSGFVLVMGVA